MADYVLSASLELNDKFTSKIGVVEKSTLKFKHNFNKTTISVIENQFKISTEFDKVANSAIKNTKKTESAFTNLRNGIVRNVSKMARAVGGSMRDVESVLSKANSSINKFGVRMFQATAGAGIALGAYSVKQAADIEKNRGILDSVLKDDKKATQAMLYANDYAIKTPYQSQEVIEGVVRLESFGIRKESIEYLGDLAAATGKPLMQAVEALVDARSGELERLKELGIRKEDIIAHSQKVGRGNLVNSHGQITDPKAFQIVLEDFVSGKYKGTAEKLNKTFYGAMSVTAGVMKSALAEIAGIGSDGKLIAGSMFDYLRNKAIGLSDHLIKMKKNGSLEKWTKKLGAEFKVLGDRVLDSWNNFKDNWTKEKTDNLINGVIGTVGLLSDGFSKIAEVAPSAFDAISKHGKTALGIVAALNATQLLLRASLGDPMAIATLGTLGAIAGGYVGYQASKYVKSITEKTGFDLVGMNVGNDNMGLSEEQKFIADKNRGVYDRTKLANSVFDPNISVTNNPIINVNGTGKLTDQQIKDLAGLVGEQVAKELVKKLQMAQQGVN